MLLTLASFQEVGHVLLMTEGFKNVQHTLEPPRVKSQLGEKSSSSRLCTVWPPWPPPYEDASERPLGCAVSFWLSSR